MKYRTFYFIFILMTFLPFFVQVEAFQFTLENGLIVTDTSGQDLKDVLKDMLDSEGKENTYNCLVRSLKNKDMTTAIISSLLSFAGSQYESGVGHGKVAENPVDVLAAFISTEDGEETTNAMCGPIHDIALQVAADAGIQGALLSGTQEGLSASTSGDHYTLLLKKDANSYVWYNYGHALEVEAKNIRQAAKLVMKNVDYFSSYGTFTIQGRSSRATYQEYQIKEETVYGDIIDKDFSIYEKPGYFLNYIKKASNYIQPAVDNNNAKFEFNSAAFNTDISLNSGDSSSLITTILSKQTDKQLKTITLNTKYDGLLLENDHVIYQDYFSYGQKRIEGEIIYETIEEGKLSQLTFSGGTMQSLDTDLFDESYDDAVFFEYIGADINGYWRGRLTLGELEGESDTNEGSLKNTKIDTFMLDLEKNWLIPNNDDFTYWIGCKFHGYFNLSSSYNSIGESSNGLSGDLRLQVHSGLSADRTIRDIKINTALELAIIGDGAVNNPSQQHFIVNPGIQTKLSIGASYPLTSKIFLFSEMAFAGIIQPDIYRKMLSVCTVGIEKKEIFKVKDLSVKVYGSFKYLGTKLTMTAMEDRLDSKYTSLAGTKFYYLKGLWQFDMGFDYIQIKEKILDTSDYYPVTSINITRLF